MEVVNTTKNTNAVPVVMPIKDAVSITGLSYSSIRQLCLNNRIRYIKSGTKYYVNMASLLRYCEGEE